MTPDEIQARIYAEIQTYIDKRWEESRNASRDAARGILLLLALRAREEFPTAAGIRIWGSDQGDFMDVQAVLDSDGNRFDGDEDFDDETLAWGLDEHNQDAWEPYCTETENSRRRNPQYVIDIDKVLKGVKLT
jgi:hypothetical protein